MPYDASPIDNPLGLSPEALAIFGELLDWLDTGGDDVCRFNYNHWHCGSSACIGGWLAYRMGNKRPTTTEVYNAAEALGIGRQSFQLFQGAQGRRSISPSSAQAAACVRHMLATGEVDWPRALEVA